MKNIKSIPQVPPGTPMQVQFNQAIKEVLEIVAGLRRARDGGSMADLEFASVNARLLLADLLELNVTAGSVGHRQIAWNSEDDTADIGHSDGVRQQVGLELYGRIYNGTGATLKNGKAIGFASSVGGLGSLAGQHYIADGSMSSLYIIGIATQDIGDDKKGRVTVWGHVRGIDTTGAAYGETWSKDQILYASPAASGGLTNVKPTAPNVCVPIAAVLFVNATEGVIFVRPTITLRQCYGVFSDATTQTALAAYTPQAVTFSTTDYADGFSRGSPISRIVADQSGLYNFRFSSEISSGNSSIKNIWIWPRINGVDVPNSNRQVTISGSGTVLASSWNWPLSMDAGDYFEIIFAVDDTALQMAAAAAQTGANGTLLFARPAVPSIVLTVSQVSQ